MVKFAQNKFLNFVTLYFGKTLLSEFLMQIENKIKAHLTTFLLFKGISYAAIQAKQLEVGTLI